MPETQALILAFDTSVAHCAAALLSGDTVLASASEEMARGQAERILPLCQELLVQAGKTVRDLDAIGVGVGPGNFTGIRISVSAARGLSLGLGVPAVGVTSFEALRLGSDAPCICAVDARRDRVYVQRFEAGLTQEPEECAAADLATSDLPVIGAFGRGPFYPVAEAIARIAAGRWRETSSRPAPLYLRAADAAPARDAPPAILS